MILGTILNIRAMYALLIPVLFNTLGFIVIYVFRLQHSGNKNTKCFKKLLKKTIFSKKMASHLCYQSGDTNNVFNVYNFNNFITLYTNYW